LVARTGFRQIRRCNGNGQREGKEGRADLPESRVAAVLCCLYLFAEEAPMSVSLAEHKGWRCCQKCTGLFFAGDPPSDRGHCPVGDQHRQFGQTAYIMQYDPGGLEYSDAEGMAGIQIGWRRCQKCEGLFLAGWAEPIAAGVCPADRDRRDRHGHLADGAYAYVVQTGPAPPGMQPSWQACQKCLGLFLADADNWEPVTCPAGGKHASDGRVSYDLIIVEPKPVLT